MNTQKIFVGSTPDYEEIYEDEGCLIIPDIEYRNEGKEATNLGDLLIYMTVNSETKEIRVTGIQHRISKTLF